MSAIILLFACLFCLAGSSFAQTSPDAPGSPSKTTGGPEMKAVIEKHLGRPYVWGASGLKSFDCSGFVWRVMVENGIMVKRTTARKFYVALPKASEAERSQFGTLIFFSNLKHIGIVNDRFTFYHSQTSKGTNLSLLNSFWKPKVCGYRAMPRRRLTTDN